MRWFSGFSTIFSMLLGCFFFPPMILQVFHSSVLVFNVFVFVCVFDDFAMVPIWSSDVKCGYLTLSMII